VEEDLEQTKNATKIYLDVTEVQAEVSEKMVSYKLEENIQSYLIYLLTVKQEDYEALTVNSKPGQVALVIIFTQIIQCYALSIMY